MVKSLVYVALVLTLACASDASDGATTTRSDSARARARWDPGPPPAALVDSLDADVWWLPAPKWDDSWSCQDPATCREEWVAAFPKLGTVVWFRLEPDGPWVSTMNAHNHPPLDVPPPWERRD